MGLTALRGSPPRTLAESCTTHPESRSEVFAFSPVPRLEPVKGVSGPVNRNRVLPLANTMNGSSQSRPGPRPKQDKDPAAKPPRDSIAHRSLAVHFSSRSDEWPTPQWLFDALNREFGFNLDPCATHNNAKCVRHFTREEDGLAQDWGAATVFMNPPYGREIRHWMRKAFESARAGATVVCLVPARTDTDWWHRYAIRGAIRFLKGRLKFGGAPHAAPFPSAVVVFRPERLHRGAASACGTAVDGEPAPLPAAVPKTPPGAQPGPALRTTANPDPLVRAPRRQRLAPIAGPRSRR